VGLAVLDLDPRRAPGGSFEGTGVHGVSAGAFAQVPARCDRASGFLGPDAALLRRRAHWFNPSFVHIHKPPVSASGFVVSAGRGSLNSPVCVRSPWTIDGGVTRPPAPVSADPVPSAACGEIIGSIPVTSMRTSPLLRQETSSFNVRDAASAPAFRSPVCVRFSRFIWRFVTRPPAPVPAQPGRAGSLRSGRWFYASIVHLLAPWYAAAR